MQSVFVIKRGKEEENKIINDIILRKSLASVY